MPAGSEQHHEPALGSQHIGKREYTLLMNAHEAFHPKVEVIQPREGPDDNATLDW